MIACALFHVAGPEGSTMTFIERLPGDAGDSILAARGVRDGSLRRSRESAPKQHT
jgi:hypothetical protein